MKTNTPRSPGRPPFHDKPMRRHQVHLDDETVEKAKAISKAAGGKGKLADGIRIAVKDSVSRPGPSQNGNPL